MPKFAADIMNKIATEFANTGSMREAYDRVMGEGAYDKLASDLYDEFNAK